MYITYYDMEDDGTLSVGDQHSERDYVCYMYWVTYNEISKTELIIFDTSHVHSACIARIKWSTTLENKQ